jgi:exosortase/archaeosortase family protein
MGVTSFRSSLVIRAIATAFATALGGVGLLKLLPSLELALFARGAAQLAGLFTGAPVQRIAEGWLLFQPEFPVVVTVACSATDYFLIVAALIGWQIARRGQHSAFAVLAVLTGLLVALPLSIAINALRIVAVSAAHRWFTPLLPAAYSSFLHLLTGAAIFLPALIALNLALEFHGRSHARPDPRART